ncbi:MAG: 5-formyltetrahydrofolate cyclo-ligase [Thermosulfidibacteraceae bacterium]
MKDTVRRNIMKIREHMDQNIKERKEVIIAEKIENLREFKKASTIALYYPIKNEVSLISIFEKYKTSKIFVFPKVNGKFLDFGTVRDLNDMIPGKFGIMEPRLADFNFDEIELIFVPAIAFDINGHRIGYGGGYYDRLLSKKRINQYAIGVCFEFQLIEKIETSKWDMSVDLVVTEKTTINTRVKSNIQKIIHL